MCALAMRRIRLCGFLFGYKRRLRKGQRPSKLTSKVTLTAFFYRERVLYLVYDLLSKDSAEDTPVWTGYKYFCSTGRIRLAACKIAQLAVSVRISSAGTKLFPRACVQSPLSERSLF